MPKFKQDRRFKIGGSDAALIRRCLRRIDRARQFPHNTCPYSRHAQMIGYYLSHGGYPQLQDEPLHCALSILITVEQLYKARKELARLKGETWTANA